jgi:hypothetical protein
MVRVRQDDEVSPPWEFAAEAAVDSVVDDMEVDVDEESVTIVDPDDGREETFTGLEELKHKLVEIYESVWSANSAVEEGEQVFGEANGDDYVDEKLAEIEELTELGWL